MHCNYFSSRIYVEKTSEQYYLSYHNSHKAKRSVRIKCIATTFLAAFMWRRLLNNAILATTTHIRLKGVSDGTSTQVRTQMINKCRIKMTQKELYNVRDPP